MFFQLLHFFLYIHPSFFYLVNYSLFPVFLHSPVSYVFFNFHVFVMVPKTLTALSPSCCCMAQVKIGDSLLVCPPELFLQSEASAFSAFHLSHNARVESLWLLGNFWFLRHSSHRIFCWHKQHILLVMANTLHEARNPIWPGFREEKVPFFM